MALPKNYYTQTNCVIASDNYIGCTRPRWTVPKPAHSGCESWLQSVRAVGRYLSQHPVAADAFAAPGTCKQLTPQNTAVGAVQCSEVQINCSLPMHLQTSQGPLHSYLAASPSVRRTLPTSGLYSIPSRLTTCNTTKLEAPPRGCHTTPTSRIRWPGIELYLCTTLTCQISTVATYQNALAPLAFNLRKGVHMSGEKYQKRKPANKARAGLCWCKIPVAGTFWPQ